MKTQQQQSKLAKEIMKDLGISKYKIRDNTNVSYHTITNFLECTTDCKISTGVEIMGYLEGMVK